MSRATRFSVAVHTLALLERFSDDRPTSEMIATSVGTNASFVRRVLSLLGRAGLVKATAGIAGASLARPAHKITLLEVYRAVSLEGEHRPAIHQEPNPSCFVGRRIQRVLDSVFGAAEAAFEAELQRRTLAHVMRMISAQAA
jgi:DNA-binding IscR family transcriptional regulator